MDSMTISSRSSSYSSEDEFPLTEIVVQSDAPAPPSEQTNTDPTNVRHLFQQYEADYQICPRTSSCQLVLERMVQFIEKRPIILAIPGFIFLLAGINRGSLVDLNSVASVVGLGLIIAGFGSELLKCNSL